ncbi:CDP-alcohol phosphatidyltransferase family protein [Candidatus Parcubacteria bacterium]|nr:CDP-alcohol phosphatidyltransferase family protein [Candidatus Parcubacteria bacterium]
MNNDSQKIVLQPQDKILAKTLLKIIPRSIMPNHFTILRFFLILPIVWMINIEQYLYGVIIFIVAAFTDAIDGALARTRNQITEWGQIYDPVADKLLIGSTAFLIISKYLNFYLAIIIIFIEILIIVNGGWRKANGHPVQANIWGKIKMHLQVYGVSLLFIFLLTNASVLIAVCWSIFILAIILAIISFFTYSL